MKKKYRKLRRRPLFVPLMAPVAAGIVLVLILAWAWPATSPRTVMLVRHADAAESAGGQVGGLNDIGRYRAKVLAGWLRDSGISRIFVTDVLAARETAAVVRESTGAELVEIPAGESSALGRALGRLKGQTVLVITDAATMSRLIERLSGRTIEASAADAAGLYIITDSILARPQLTRLNYGG